MSPDDVLTWLRAEASEDHRASLARYGIPLEGSLGVPMGVMKNNAKAWGYDHPCALELWKDGSYEARTMAAHLADPALLDGATMDAWTADFDNWAICDTCCYQLFAKTRPRWEKVHAYAGRDEEFVKRTSFALIWALTRHDKGASDSSFTDTFPLIEDAASDPRPLVSKAVDMALRAIGKRNAALNKAATDLAEELANSSDKNKAKVGRKCARELTSEKVRSKL
ncbi:MAG: DNA alkylation repair protein [Pseudomonadota bacterium]